MPVADYPTYCKMLDRAREGHFAYPAINVTSLTTANAVLKGLAESQSDGIIQVSTGGAAFASGSSVKDMVLGAVSIAEHVHRAAERYPLYVALHTDHHCQADKLDRYVLPWGGNGAAAGRREAQSIQQPHVRRQRLAPERQPGYFHQTAGTVSKERIDSGNRSRGGRWGGRRQQGRGVGQALYPPEDTLEVARRLNASAGPATCWRPPLETCTASTNRGP